MTLQVLHFPLTADNVPRSLCLSFPLISSLSISFSFSLGLSVVRTHINFFFLLRLYIFFFFFPFCVVGFTPKICCWFCLGFLFLSTSLLSLVTRGNVTSFLVCVCLRLPFCGGCSRLSIDYGPLYRPRVLSSI